MNSLPVTRPAPELPAGPRAALFIATGRYSALPQLDAAARDAAEISRALADPNIGAFEVTSIVDRNVEEIRSALEDFLEQRHRGDTIVVYVSCHGLLDKQDRLYFAATDTRKDRLAETGVEAGWLLDRLEECQAARQVVILDCCNSGAFGRAGGKGEADANLRLPLRFSSTGRGRAVLTATRASQRSGEGDRIDVVRTSSVFTSALVEGLRTGTADADGDGYVSVDEAYTYAYEKVGASGTDQVLQRWISVGVGELLLARNPVGLPIVPATLSEETQARSPTSNFDLQSLLDQRRFVDRDGELATCRKELSESRFLIIHGLDGQGKTTLARVYAAKNQNDYDFVWFIPASHESGVTAALEGLAKELRLATAQERDLRDRLIALREKLTTGNRWLLIFDDVTDWKSIRDYIPPPKGHIIATTESTDWTQDVHDPMPSYLHLIGLPRPASKKYLMDHIEGASDSAADRLADNLGDLPFALELAVKNLAMEGSIPEAYNESSEALRTLWQGTIDRLRDMSPLAHSLLELCSLFASDPIPEPVLKRPSQENGPEVAPRETEPLDELRRALNDSAKYSDLVEILRISSLVEAHPESGAITVHRLLQTYLLGNMPCERRRNLLSVAIDLLLDTFNEGWLHVDRCALALPHAEACLKHAEACLKIAEQEAEQDEIAWGKVSTLMVRMAHFHRSRGEIFKARDLHEQALKVREKAFGKDSREVARSLINLGIVLTEMGEPSEAVKIEKRSLEILSSVEPPDEKNAAICRDNLGLALAACGQYAQAIDLHKQAYDFWIKKDRRHSNAALTLDNMGCALYILGDLSQAEKVLHRAVQIGREVLDADFPFDKLDLAEMLHNQGQILRARASVYDAWRARPILREALSLRSREFGNQHLSVIETRTALARVFRCLGEHASADKEVKKARQAINGLRRSNALGLGPPGSLDPSSRYLCTVLIAEGELRFARADYKGARQRLEQAKKLADTSVLRLPSVEYAELMENLGRVYNADPPSAGEPSAGEHWMEKAAETRTRLNEEKASVSRIIEEVGRDNSGL